METFEIVLFIFLSFLLFEFNVFILSVCIILFVYSKSSNIFVD